MRRTSKTLALIIASALALSACGGDTSEKEKPGNTDSKIKVGMAYDVGGRGDQSFNDSAATGLDKAAKEFGFATKEAEASDGESEAQREERLRTFADAGYDPIIAVGFAYSASVAKVGAEYPDVNFAIIDDDQAVADNIANLVFAEEQGSFLVGAAAALKTETDNIGYIGGVETPLIQKFQAGYEAGAKAVNPDIKIQATYLTQVPDFSGFADPSKGKTAANGMFDNGADIIFHAAGGSGGGLFEAAQAAGKRAIGVDSDQALTADPAVRDVIMTSMLKNIDVAVFEFLTKVNDGKFPSGVTRYDLAVDGVGYSTTGGQIDDIVSKLDDFKKQIVDGAITVPTKP